MIPLFLPSGMPLWSSLWRIAHRRQAVTISDKFWKEQHQKLRSYLKQQGGRVPDVRYRLAHDLREFFAELQDVLILNLRQTKARAAVQGRIDNAFTVIGTLVERLKKLQETLTMFPPALGPQDEVVRWLASEAWDSLDKAFPRLEDAVKVSYRVDPDVLQATAKKLVGKMTPQEREAWDPAHNEDFGQASTLRYRTIDSQKFEEVARKLVKKEKNTYDVAGFVVNLEKMLADSFSQGALQKADDLLEFDIHGVKVLVDEKSYPHPEQIKNYIKALDVCYNLMRSKGLSKAWYGTVFLECKGCDGPNTGAHFHGREDVVRFFSPYSSGPWVTETMAHELGHRYWFKQMTQDQRIRFEFFVNAPDYHIQWEKRPERDDVDRWFPVLPDSAIQEYLGKVDQLLQEVSTALKPYLGIRKPKSWSKIVDEMEDGIVRAGSRLRQEFPYQMEGGHVADNRELQRLRDELYKAVHETSQHLSNWAHDASTYHASYPDGVTYEEIFKDVRQKWVQKTKELLGSVRKLAAQFAPFYLSEFNAEQEQKRKNSRPWQVENFKDVSDRVAPVSEYGKTNIAEAFAEVFAHFVVGKDMTRDQIESFKAVLGPGVRAGSIQRILSHVHQRPPRARGVAPHGR